MDNNILPAIIIEPQTIPVTASVIWLHGLGADGNDFSPLVPHLSLPEDLGIRFIFPHAPKRPITINGGYVMRAWYDINSREFDNKEDDTGILASEKSVCQLMRREIENGIKASRIILAGFSQGGAIALHTGLRYPESLAGILALSTYLPLAAKLPVERHSANNDIDIMMAHGTQDTIVPLKLAQQSYQFMEKLGYRISWHNYPMEHSVCPEEIEDIAYWLKQRLYY